MNGRSPKNLQDLLKYAISHQNNGYNYQCSAIEEDNKFFLENVLQSMSVNVIEEFLKAIQILQDNHTNSEDKCEALDLIRDYVDNIDFANSFVKIGGAEILMKCIKDDNKAIQINAINILAEMSQNNSFCQKFFLDNGVIKFMVMLLDNNDAHIVTSALYALSALVRNFEPALTELINNDGLKKILNCLNNKSPRVFVKTCFLISSLSSEFSIIRDEFTKLNAFKILSSNLKFIDDFNIEVEMLLIAMSELIKSSYCNPDIKLKIYIENIINDIINHNKNNPQCKEIIFYSTLILDNMKK